MVVKVVKGLRWDHQWLDDCPNRWSSTFWYRWCRLSELGRQSWSLVYIKFHQSVLMVNNDSVVSGNKRLLFFKFHSGYVKVADLEFLLHFDSFFFQFLPLYFPLFLLGWEYYVLFSLDFLCRRGLRRKLKMITRLIFLLLSRWTINFRLLIIFRFIGSVVIWCPSLFMLKVFFNDGSCVHLLRCLLRLFSGCHILSLALFV